MTTETTGAAYGVYTEDVPVIRTGLTKGGMPGATLGLQAEYPTIWQAPASLDPFWPGYRKFLSWQMLNRNWDRYSASRGESTTRKLQRRSFAMLDPR